MHYQVNRNYKVISAEYYLANFASDRSHMINKKTGKYNSEPPTYPCIKTDSKIKKNYCISVFNN